VLVSGNSCIWESCGLNSAGISTILSGSSWFSAVLPNKYSDSVSIHDLCQYNSLYTIIALNGRLIRVYLFWKGHTASLYTPQIITDNVVIPKIYLPFFPFKIRNIGRHYATSRKVAGLSPNTIIENFNSPIALDPGVYSASNRNYYQKQKSNVSGE
jgi:hypothetical protein